MPNREKYIEILSKVAKKVKEFNEDTPIKISLQCVEDILELLKEQEVEKPVMPWNVLGRLDDGTYKGKCGNCGFVHYFIEGHDAQYKFCPQCGEQKQEL